MYMTVLHVLVCLLWCSLPIESGGGQLVVEESVRGKKKEAVFQCALKACRILDSNDMLRVASKRELAHTDQNSTMYNNHEDCNWD